MSAEYKEAMDRITVTPDMKVRILNNVRHSAETAPKKIIPFSEKYKKYISFAACFIVVLAAALITAHIMQKPDINKTGDAGTYAPQEVSSAKELSKACGFDISDLSYLPFTPDSSDYIYDGDGLAEIDYSSQNMTAKYRKSSGSEDNSGDYSDYDQTEKIECGKYKVTLKGSGGKYSLAVYTDGKYSYSISLSGGVSSDEWQKIIKGT